MANCYGENLKLTLFGTSHGPSIGMTLEGIPAGLSVNFAQLQAFLDRRAPGQNAWSTARKEADVPHFSSGIAGGITTGDAITAEIFNENIRSADYDNLKHIPRPGHADFTAWAKYGPDFDMTGGGPFSGRMTAPMCIAGGLCKQWLEAKGIRIGAHISSIAYFSDAAFDKVKPELSAVCKDFPILDREAGEKMQEALAAVAKRGDSLGGVIECAVIGLPAGIGSELFGGLEAKIAQAVYAIPAVKGVEFGLGFDFTYHFGSFSNDAFVVEDGAVRTETNHCGGILGGISTGMPVIFRAAFKPTPSISRPQRSVNLETMEEVTLTIQGRHDPCVVPRAVPVVEAAAAVAVFDLLLTP